VADEAKPRVAILGASSDRSKYGNKSVRAHVAAGYDVFPIHPTEATIEGLRAYASLADVPARLDRVSVYLPPKRLLPLLPQIAAVHPAELYLNPGTESDEVIRAAEALGLRPILACSIVDIGLRPAQFPS